MKLSGKVRWTIIVTSMVVVVLTGGRLSWPKLAMRAHVATVHADGGCSVASLKGPYAVARQGTLVTSVPALSLVAPAPWAEVALVNIDGAGSFSGKATVNIGGAVLSDVPFTGTYTVNSDCTGTNTVAAPSVGITIHQALVVIGGGQRFIETEADSLAVVEGRIEKLGD